MADKKLGRTHAIGVQLDADKVLLELHRRGWRQVDLANAAEISQMTVSNIVRGHPCSAIVARAIQKAFDENPPVLDGLMEKSA